MHIMHIMHLMILSFRKPTSLHHLTDTLIPEGLPQGYQDPLRLLTAASREVATGKIQDVV